MDSPRLKYRRRCSKRRDSYIKLFPPTRFLSSTSISRTSVSTHYSRSPGFRPPFLLLAYGRAEGGGGAHHRPEVVALARLLAEQPRRNVDQEPGARSPLWKSTRSHGQSHLLRGACVPAAQALHRRVWHSNSLAQAARVVPSPSTRPFASVGAIDISLRRDRATAAAHRRGPLVRACLHDGSSVRKHGPSGSRGRSGIPPYACISSAGLSTLGERSAVNALQSRRCSVTL